MINLKNLKEIYDKYILMEERFNNLEQKLNDALQKIAALEAVVKHSDNNKYLCRSCHKGLYRATNKPRRFHGFTVGNIWECDTCGHIADEQLSQKLSS
ncbi:hypothetical protein [Candidatus Proelusimicrobium volucris]|uniref:hypothetical protein n=1 Tax=Candidatus Proelusimicrobium volucris TaxID=3416225 RepID=UPI003D0E6188